jgi:predicted P-loop ATPase
MVAQAQPGAPGALARDWAHWQGLGLTADLLPVVSDLNASISEKSSLKAIGKTPSLFNRAGDVVGIPDWTQKRSVDRDIGRWAQDQRLGISIQCRLLRAIDIDIGDTSVADDIVAYIHLVTGELPMRYRSNSGKCLLVFTMAGEFVKRVIHTAHGAIEFLANGQQFIAVGTHPSGERYQWRGGLPAAVPQVPPAEFAVLWAGLQGTYGIEPERVARGGLVRPTVARVPNASVDDTTLFLEGNGWVRSWTHDGRVNITCPWSDQHTVDSDESATQYFPAGVGGFALGHFKCLHAHCAGRGDGDFLDAIGLVADEFEDMTGAVVTALDGSAGVVAAGLSAGIDTSVDRAVGAGGAVGAVGVVGASVAPPNYARTRNGEVAATITNLVMALSRDDQCGMRIAWDVFLDEIVWASPVGAGRGDDWRAFRDHDYVQLRIHLQRPLSAGGVNFKEIGRELIRDGVHFVAMRNMMDSATTWAKSLVWDGVERVHTFFHRYFRAADTPYTRAAGLYAWSALAGRALVPGVKADMAVILKSEQGTIKTEGIKALAPHGGSFKEIDLSKPDDALARMTRGALVVEISELRGLNSRDQGAIKAWVSRTHEEWVPKFKEFSTKFPRRFICFGSTNEDEFLADDTGERRWLPMEVGRTDIAALRRDCEQLWAEGVQLFEQGGVLWQEAERLARFEHGRFKVQDSWHNVLCAWLAEDAFGEIEGIRQGDFPLRMHHVLHSAFGVQVQNISRKDELRVAHLLRREGYKPTTVRITNGVFRAWVNDERIAAAQRIRQLASSVG